MFLIIYLTFIIWLAYYFTKKVRNNHFTNKKAVGFYSLFTTTPVVIYGVIFLILLGVEEFTTYSPISEMYGRTLLLVLVGGLVISIISTFILALFLFATKRWKN